MVKSLRAVGDEEREAEPVEPLTLLAAVESGDVLEMLLAQRRLIAEALTSAAENTRPQFNNELNKLHVLIREEQSRRVVEEQEVAGRGNRARKPFDAAAI